MPGILVNWQRFFAPKQTTLSLSQPLLWYRLLPNATYPPGILLGLIISTGSLIILMTWLVISKRWKLDRLQQLAGLVASLGFLIAGLVASTKIGGGSNLHNLDMFLISLTILAALYLVYAGKISSFIWPRWSQGILILALLIPAWNAYSRGTPFVLPQREVVETSLDGIREYVKEAAKQGEVIFLDQRQLLTFGKIKGVPLVPEYEKKYMMDQAMAGNYVYFENFYSDLANKRFALIVSEPLNTKKQDRSNAFSEENNTWVKWVSKPLLCYYEPIEIFKRVHVELLVPRQGTSDCP